jgi:hypothetical protein
VNKKQKKRRAKAKRAGRVAPRAQGPPGSQYFYTSFENPLRDLSDAEADRIISEIASHHMTSFSDAFRELRSQVLDMEPQSLLASFSAYALTSPEGELREWSEKDPILQHHVELLQAILLMQQPSPNGRPSNPGDLSVIEDLVRRASESFFLRRMGSLAGADPARRARLMLDRGP